MWQAKTEGDMAPVERALVLAALAAAVGMVVRDDGARLEAASVVVLAFRRHEHVFGVSRDVTGRDPQFAVHQLRRIHLLITGLRLAAADVVFQHLEQRPALMMPEH